MIRKSSYYDGKQFITPDGRRTEFARVWGGVSFPGNFALAIGEEKFINQTYYYLLAEAEARNVDEMMGYLRSMTAMFKVDRWIGDVDKEVGDFLRIDNRQAFRAGIRSVMVYPAPLAGDYLDLILGPVHAALTPVKRLWFWGQSTVPAELQSIPDKKARADEYPRTAALAYALGGMAITGAEQYDEADLIPAVEEEY